MVDSPQNETRSAEPKLSVIIASAEGATSLEDCVASFVCQPRGDEIEVLVAERSSNGALKNIDARYPNVRFIHFAGRKSIPELRAAAILQARGAILALTEDHCLADPSWVERALSAHSAADLAIGGAVENIATERLIDWAVFFCEYSRYMRPIRAGATSDLPGPNVTYKRAALEYFRDLLAPATWETFWHARLLERGIRLVNDPRLIIYHRKNFTLRGFLSERYHYARSFAGRRVLEEPRRRGLFALAAPLLPPLLLWRIIATVLGKGRHRRELFLSLPYLVLFTVVWSVGELIGYVFGAGDSLEKIG